MRELGSCEGGISREHLISESVILILKADGDFSVSGLPWLAEGETKILGSKSLTANCLCRRHNSALSPLDDAARYFVSALKSCLDREPTADTRYLLSGHDLERWLLKTAKALAASKNLARGHDPLSGAFASDVRVLDMLDDPRHWPRGSGLYCVMNAGDRTANHNRFQLVPYTNAQEEISALGVNVLGLDFILLLEAADFSLVPPLKKATFRPNQIVISYPGSTNWIALSWEDSEQHINSLSLKFLRPLDP